MEVRIMVEPNFENGEKRIHRLDGISRPYRVTYCRVALKSVLQRSRCRLIPLEGPSGLSSTLLIGQNSDE